MSRGEDSGSTPRYELENSQPTSRFHLNQSKPVVAISRLQAIEEVHSQFLGANQEIGNSIIVGIIIFSIVVD